MFDFIGISPHLRINAFGHFETLHKVLFFALQKDQDFSELYYLGSALDKNVQAWFTPSIPTTTTSTVPWSSKKLYSHFLKIVEKSKSEVTIIHIYEGNIYWLLILGKVIRKTENTYLYINFFKGEKYRRLRMDALKKFYFRSIFKIVSGDIADRIVFTADSLASAEILTSITRQNFIRYPLFSAFQEFQFENRNSRKILCLLRGKTASDLIYQVAKELPNETKERLTVHGVLSTTQETDLKKQGFIISKAHLDFLQYKKFFESFSRIIFMYDPAEFGLDSSGRLCDALVTGKEVFVPRNSALEEDSMIYEGVNCYKFGDQIELAKILNLEVFESMRYQNPPTVAKSISEIKSGILLKKNVKSKVPSKANVLLRDITIHLIWLSYGIGRIFFGARRYLFGAK